MKVERLTGTQDEIMAQAVAVCYGKEPSVERVGRVVNGQRHRSVLRFGYAAMECEHEPDWETVAENKFLNWNRLRGRSGVRISGNLHAWMDYIGHLCMTGDHYTADEVESLLSQASPQCFRDCIDTSSSCHKLTDLEPDEYVAYKISGISISAREHAVRHTNLPWEHDVMPHAMLAESSRYCDLRNAELIAPPGKEDLFHSVSRSQMGVYVALRDEHGCTKEEARRALGVGTATTLCMAGRRQDWEAFVKLRTGKGAEWEIADVAQAIKEDLGL